jgi:crossover junction endodeoxyribonuclease RuvC
MLVRVLGVDPGLTRCGIGIVEQSPGQSPQLVDVGVVRTTPDQPHEQRLLAIEQGIDQWVDTFAPDAIAVERVFAQQNLHSVTGTAQAAGIAMLIAARRGIPVALHTPTEVKAAITGSGSAGKAQVGAMVARVLKLSNPPKPADSADALALALCHLWRGGAVNRYAAAVAAAKKGGR